MSLREDLGPEDYDACVTIWRHYCSGARWAEQHETMCRRLRRRGVWNGGWRTETSGHFRKNGGLR